MCATKVPGGAVMTAAALFPITWLGEGKVPTFVLLHFNIIISDIGFSGFFKNLIN